MTYQGARDARQGRYAIVVSQFNASLVEKLLSGAVSALKENGASDDRIDLVKVPGAFEIPLASLKAAQSGRYAAVIALGAVIRGNTAHFEYVAGEAARGIAEASLRSGVPVIFGVLTTDTLEDAVERTKPGNNKGYEAALAALEMANLIRQL